MGAMGAESEELISSAPTSVRELGNHIKDLHGRVQEMKQLYNHMEEEEAMDVALKKEFVDEIEAMSQFEDKASAIFDEGLHKKPVKVQDLEELFHIYESIDEESEAIARVAPEGDRWWRYEYEYVFVQSMMLVFLFFIFAVISVPFTLLRVERPGNADLLYKWFAEASHALSVTALAALAVLSLFRADKGFLLTWAPRILAVIPGGSNLRMPQTKLQWENVLVDVILCSFAVVVVFYSLMRVLVTACEDKKLHWYKLDRKLPPWVREDEPVRSGDGPAVLLRAPTLVNNDVNNFATVRDYFIRHLLDPEERLHSALADLHGASLTDKRIKHFRLSWYFREHVDDVLLDLVTIRWMTWLFLLFWYVAVSYFACMLKCTYLHLMALVASTSSCVFVFMYWSAKHRYSMLDSIQEGLIIRPDDHSPWCGCCGIPHLVMLEAVRCGIIMLIFGAAQFIGSPFCWQYYFIANLGFLLLLVGFLLTWCFHWALIVPCYAAAHGLPPFYAWNGDNTHSHVLFIDAALQDENEWCVLEDKAEKGMLATPQDK